MHRYRNHEWIGVLWPNGIINDSFMVDMRLDYALTSLNLSLN